MKNAMQLKAIIKKLAKEMNVSKIMEWLLLMSVIMQELRHMRL